MNQNNLIIIFLVAVFLIIIFLYLCFKQRRSYAELIRIQSIKDKLLSIIAHDLKAPFNSYQGMADAINYLIKTKQYERIQDISKQIDITGANILLMLDNILDWSNFQKSTSKFSKLRFSLVKEINVILPIYSNIANLRNITFMVQMPTKVLVYGNSYSISVIIRNLLDNALKNSRSKVEIWVDTNKSLNGSSFIIKNDLPVIIPTGAFDALTYLNSSSKNINEINSIGLQLIKRYAKLNMIKIEASIEDDFFLVKLFFENA